MAPKDDIVYALHDFEAENEDELSFQFGEVIVVLERDDQYGDGWFSGRNTAGEVGLFPQSYTSVDPPEPQQDDSQRQNGAHTPLDSVVANSSQVDQTLQRLGVDGGFDRADAASVRSRASKADSDEDVSAPTQNHRATLAARAVAEVAAAQRAKEEAAATRRKADEEAYRKSGLIDGLQLSDESDDDDISTSLIPPKLEKRPSISEVIQPTPAPAPAAEAASAPASANTSPSIAIGGEPLTKQKSRADTIASFYAESTYSNASPPPPVPALGRDRAGSGTAADYQALAAEPTLHYSAENDDAKEELSPNLNGLSPQLDVPKSPSLSDPESTPIPPTSSTLGPGHTAEVIVGAGLTGIAAAAAAVAHPFTSSKPKEAEAEAEAAPLPSSAAVQAPTPSVVEPAATNGYSNGVQHSLASPAVPAVRALTPPPPPLDTRASTLAGTASPVHPSPIRSDSRTSSPGFRPGASVGSTNDASAGLPFDPRTWGVDEVVHWATGKGFDDLTISKFREHEISGDVLLELDIAMLKEIDLPAFGRRVHIYNAIKELKTRIAPASGHSSTRPGSLMSPGLSGYEPDSPATTVSYATPLQAGAFASPTTYNTFGSGAFSSDDGVQGLGFEEDRRSTSSASQPLRPTRSRTALIAAGGHVRSSTIGTENSFSSNGIPPPQIVEEGEDLDAAKSGGSTPSVESRPAQSRSRKASSRMSIRGKSTDKRSGGSNPSSPNPSVAGGKTPKQEQRSSFFGATLGRSRKPPPRVPSSTSIDTKSQGVTPRPRQSLQNNASKRATRLFSSFGSAGEKSPIIGGSRKSVASGGLTTREGPSSMTPKTVDEAGEEMVRKDQADVQKGDLMEKLGSPDFSGWMQKKGEKYNGWKQRFLVLKGVHLYWLKSESEQRIKGFINLTGYRVISDPDIHPGQFGFKIVHDTERAHHFSAAEQVTVRNWMKEIMKATIGRDYSAPVVSSCDIDTLPLKVAQSMSPRPRPPSPTERAQIQKERYAGANPNTLTPKDAQILMEFAPGSPLMTSPKLGSASPSLGGAGSRLSMMSFPSKGGVSPSPSSSLIKPLAVDNVDRTNDATPNAATPTPASPTMEGPARDDLLDWVNDHLPLSVTPVNDLGNSLRSGRILVRLLEELSHQPSGISEADFDSYRAPGAGGDWDAAYFDVVFNVFDYISPIVSTDGIAMDDMLRGNEPLLAMLLERYREKFA